MFNSLGGSSMSLFRLLALLCLVSPLHTTLSHCNQSHVMVLGNVQDEDLKQIKLKLTETRGEQPSFSYQESDKTGKCHYHQNRQEWIQFFSKTLLEKRLNFRLGDTVECFFFPTSARTPLTACALIGDEDEMATLETTLLELKDISIYGISEWELTKAKELVWNWLYHADNAITEKSSYILQTISAKDIQYYLRPLYAYVDKELYLSQPFEDEGDEDTIQVQLCSITLNNTDHFYSLPISGADKNNITWIINTIAKSNLVKLGLNGNDVRKRGDKIEHVHPLRFLSYVMGEGGLRGDMKKITKSSFKWNNFMDSFSKRLTREMNNNNLLPYVSGFAHSLNVDENTVRSIIERQDWYGLLNYFL